VVVTVFALMIISVIIGATYDPPPCPQLPIDNELIYVNDSTYHRIHVRIDTTLYYADKPQAIEITH
jgi:hypothetical protein